ncbi:glycosyltransferase [Granulicoccus sp. GXG6511]|uniref:glycosyltransferase n=1 Tax=Granulicoccus sp. GXG6511 TaxID=3381351 RepID=UPI003D7E590B
MTRVLFVQRQPCIKTWKYAVGLRATIPDLVLGFAYQGKTLTELYGGGDELFDEWHLLPVEPDARLAEVIKDFEPDLVHNHNLPDVLTMACQRVLGPLGERPVPIIHDVHDFQALRKTPYEDGFPDPEDPAAAERAAVEQSDALVTVSDRLLEEIQARYAVPELHAVFPNYALAQHLPALGDLPEVPDRLVHSTERPLRVVYQGTLSVAHGHYDLRGIFAAIAGSGAELHVFPGRGPMPEYFELAERFPTITIHPTLPSTELLATLPQFDVGWAGFNDTLNDAHLATVLPNKGFEYVGCGLPILTFEHDALARWVRADGIGVVVGSPEELPKVLTETDFAPMAQRTHEIRDSVTIEGAVDTVVERIYRPLLAARVTAG